MSRPKPQTFSQQQMPLTSYEPCFMDLRQAVITCAEDQNSLVVKQRTWQQILASASVIYKTQLPALTIQKEGWSALQNGNTCKIRSDSGLPHNLHNVRCTLSQKVTRGSGGPMWKVSTCGDGVESQKLEVRQDHLFKIHGIPDDFECLKDTFWMGGDTFNSFMEIMCQNMGWGYNKMPPAQKQISGKRQLWIANSFLLNQDDYDDPLRGMNRGVSGKVVAAQFTSVHKDLAEASASTNPKHKEAMAEIRDRALSVTDAILTINPASQHWSYAIVDFQNCLITLDDPFGMPASIHGIKQRLGIVRILKKVHSWAVNMQTARDERSRPFTFRVRVTCTQEDGHQCGPHTTANILLYTGNVDDKRASTVVAQDMRLWVAYMLWLHGDVSIKLPSLNANHGA